MKMGEWKVEKKESSEIIRNATGVTHIIFVAGPRGGNYMFYRNAKNQTWFALGNTRHVKAYYTAMDLAVAA